MLNPTLRLIFAGLLLLVARTHGLEIKESRWGFDGKVVPGRFNLLSARVFEAGPKPFDGEISLFESRGAEQTVGAPVVQPVYVTPGTERWVQFLVFVPAEYEWILRWGKGDKQREKIAAPKSGPAATVVLLDSSTPFASETRLRAFPEDLFPTSVAGTDALDQVVMDHVPRWDAPRREAFLDWVHRGGVVHLVRGPGGHPVFEGELAVLNTTDPKQHIGGGRVLRHEMLRAELNDEALAQAGFPMQQEVEDNSGGHRFWIFDQELLTSLASLTKPEVAWPILYLLTLGYLVVIGPVHYKWSRKVDYRVAIGGFLGTVVVFAIAFIITGRRGSDEIQASHSLGLARALPGNRWDTMQWLSAFATSGDYYRLSHGASVNYYSATSDVEAVNGKIVGGRDGFFEVDIPLYSSRPFLHRGVFAGPDLQVAVTEWNNRRLAISDGGKFPDGTKQVVAQIGDRFVPLTKTDDAWVGNPDSGRGAKEIVRFESNQYGWDRYGWSNRDLKPEAGFEAMLSIFLGDVESGKVGEVSRKLAPNRIRLFVFAKTPKAFATKAKDFHQGQGYLLFVKDLFRDGAAAPAAPSAQ